MRYQVLLLNVSSDLHHALTHRLQGMNVDFTLVYSHQNVVHLCAEHSFHLIVLHFPDTTLCNEFLIALRRVSYTPTIVLLDQYDAERACSVLESGADLCVGIKWPVDLTADHIMAQFRRFVAYTHEKSTKEHDFQVGDIYIDPLRYVVRVKERQTAPTGV